MPTIAAALSAPDQRSCDLSCHQEEIAQVQLHLLVPDRTGGFQQRSPRGGTDDRYHDVEPAEPGLGFGDDGGDLAVVQHVPDDGEGLPADGGDILTDTVGSLRHEVDQCDVATGTGEATRRAFTHSLAATDDQGLLAGKSKKRGFVDHRRPYRLRSLWFRRLR
jgi:hypothetical protein